MNKIKVIDLLNMISKGEEVPKKIKWLGQIYEYSRSNRFYYQNSWSMYRDFYTEGNCLNEEVEILDEGPKKIENFYFSVYQDQKLGGRDVVQNLEKKINELIDEINNLKDKKDEQEK